MTEKTPLFDLLKSNHVFARLDRYAFGILEDYLSFRQLTADEYLFYEGEVGDYMAFVLAGSLAVIKNVHQQEVVLATFGSGDSIGDMALIDDLPRSASIKATEKSALLILPKADFDRVLRDHPRIGVAMLKGIATMLSLNLRRTSDALSQARTAQAEHAKVCQHNEYGDVMMAERQKITNTVPSDVSISMEE